MNAQAIVFLIGAIVTLSGHGHHGRSGAPATECHIKFVSFGFSGTPGTPVTYHGESYVLPASGHLELIAHKGDFTFQAAGLTMSLSDETPRDEFGSAAIDVDRSLAEARALTATVQVADSSTHSPASATRPATF